jgi:hypothetical protein
MHENCNKLSRAVFEKRRVQTTLNEHVALLIYYNLFHSVMNSWDLLRGDTAHIRLPRIFVLETATVSVKAIAEIRNDVSCGAYFKKIRHIKMIFSYHILLR